MLSKGVTAEEAVHAMLAVGVPSHAAAAAAASASSVAASSALPHSPERNKPSLLRRVLVVGTGLVGAWSAWNLYGETVMKWGSGVLQWLEGGGEAAADSQQQQQQNSDQVGPLLASHPPSRTPSSRPGDEETELVLQQSSTPTHTQITDGKERELQAEALKVA